MTNLNEECLLQFLQKSRQAKEKKGPVNRKGLQHGDLESKPANPFMSWPGVTESRELD